MPSDSLQHLRHLIEHAAHLLPAQGPIPVFIHHNTLHAFEDQPFEDAVVQGARVFGCQPFLSEHRYREELARGRIRSEDLDAVLREDLGSKADEPVPTRGTRAELRRAMLQYPLRTGTTHELLWLVAETDALRQVRAEVPMATRAQLVAQTRRWALRDLRGRADIAPELAELFQRFGARRVGDWDDSTWEEFTLQALWRICRVGAERAPRVLLTAPRPVRHRDLLLDATGRDSDLLVHEILIRFCAVFLDQGLARWPLPGRDGGFFASFAALYRQPGISPELWRCELATELNRLVERKLAPLESIHESLTILGVAENELDGFRFLTATLLALRGWAGIIRFLEERPDRALHPVPEDSLIEFLAIRLLLDRLALAYLAREALGYTGPLNGLRAELRTRIAPARPPSAEQRAFQVFRLAQAAGWIPEELARLTNAEWGTLFREVEKFSGLDRRRVFHLAYERRFYIRTLDALAAHARNPAVNPQPARFQAIFCIDEREESIRRHLEEVGRDVETFGTAGFFSVAMYYRGADDAHYTPLCPAVMFPKHWVVEEVVGDLAKEHGRRSRFRRAVAAAAHRAHVGSRSFLAGALLALVGVAASVPLVARTLFPRLTARLRRRVSELVRAPAGTRLRLERTDPTPGPDGGHIGYTLEELTNVGEKVLRDIGLVAGYSRLVFVFGHGSTSMNNPHESAHDCGACGGGRGGPNARALAQILNDTRVRDGLTQRGIAIPPEAVFVGGMHNTSSEEVSLFDLDRVPESHRAELERAWAEIEEAADRDAHERARRFESAPLSLTPQGARRHMEGRAEDLSQVRPEWGHATNAICIVGRRGRTRGLFLDRRAFLNSYDSTQDDAKATVLTRTLQAVFPVCGGINLEYYFSYVDNPGYGCGTKLPHNITSLLGVMDGAGSDLRTGLPWQMVEIHEPVRLLFVLETTPGVILGILEKHPVLGRMARNGWVKLAVLDPQSPAIRVYRGGTFHPYEPEVTVLPRAPTSMDWYRGWRDHLDFAVIGG